MVKSQSKPAFVEVFVDKDVLQEIWSTMITPMAINTLKWDEIPEAGRKIIADTIPMYAPLVWGWIAPDWIENVKAMGREIPWAP